MIASEPAFQVEFLPITEQRIHIGAFLVEHDAAIHLRKRLRQIEVVLPKPLWRRPVAHMRAGKFEPLKDAKKIAQVGGHTNVGVEVERFPERRPADIIVFPPAGGSLNPGYEIKQGVCDLLIGEYADPEPGIGLAHRPRRITGGGCVVRSGDDEEDAFVRIQHPITNMALPYARQ